MEEQWVALLGVKGGPAIRPNSSMPTSSLVRMGNKNILIDAGLGVSRGICDQGIQLTDIDLIVITHLHSDHYLELGPLIHTAWTCGLRRKIPIIGPKGLDAYFRNFLVSMDFDIALRIDDEGRIPLESLVEISEIHEGEVYNDSVKIEARRNYHPPIKDSFALRLTAGGKSLVMSGDTAPFDGWGDFIKNADLLVHEVMLLEGVDALIERIQKPNPKLRDHIVRSHTDTDTLGQLATDADVKALAINHFVPDGLPGFGAEKWIEAMKHTWRGPLHIGKDGLRIVI